MRLVHVILLLLSAVALGQSSVGERLYKGKCANCHSVDGSASSPLGRHLQLRDLRSPQVQQLSDKDLLEIIAKGRRNMPAFQRQFKSDQLSEIVRYLKTLPLQSPMNPQVSGATQ